MCTQKNSAKLLKKKNFAFCNLKYTTKIFIKKKVNECTAFYASQINKYEQDQFITYMRKLQSVCFIYFLIFVVAQIH